MASDKVSQAGSIFDPTLLSRCISCGFCLPACPRGIMCLAHGSPPAFSAERYLLRYFRRVIHDSVQGRRTGPPSPFA